MTKQNVLDFIKENPNCSVDAIVNHFDLKPFQSSLTQYLNELEEEGKIGRGEGSISALIAL